MYASVSTQRAVRKGRDVTATTAQIELAFEPRTVTLTLLVPAP